MTQLYLMSWTEYEAGWGNRPDGYTIHNDLLKAKEYIKDIIKKSHYDCFIRPDWTDFDVIEVEEPLDFGDRGFIWFPVKDINGYTTTSTENGIKNVKEFSPKINFKVLGKVAV